MPNFNNNNQLPLIYEDKVTLEIPDAGLKLDNWMSYELSNDWMDCNGNWQVTIADGNYEDIIEQVQNNAKVYFKINGETQATGYIEYMEVTNDNSGGTILVLAGRDCLATVARCSIDVQKFSFAESTSVKDVVTQLVTPFGFKRVQVDDTINRQKITGKQVKFEYNSELEKIINTPLNKKWRPHTSEGVYQFIERIGKRFGFHCWCSADGDTLFCGTPDYDTPAINNIYRYKKSISPEFVKYNNVLKSSIKYNVSEQPSVVIGFGSGGGGDKRWQALRVIMVNELVTTNPPDSVVQDIIDRYVGTKDAPGINTKLIERRDSEVIDVPSQIKPNTKIPFINIVHDDESKTLQQLQNYVRSVMASFQEKCVVLKYTVQGHSQIDVNGDRAVWQPNTQVDVWDEVANIKQTMWIKSRRFIKSRSAGTTTEIECILPHTLELFNVPDEAPAMGSKAPEKNTTNSSYKPYQRAYNIEEERTGNKR